MKKRVRIYADGGPAEEQQGGGQMEQLLQAIQQMIQQGAQPVQVAQQLLGSQVPPEAVMQAFVQLGMPQEEAQMSIQQAMQGGQEQPQGPGEEQMEGAASNPQEEMQEQEPQGPTEQEVQMAFGGPAPLNEKSNSFIRDRQANFINAIRKNTFSSMAKNNIFGNDETKMKYGGDLPKADWGSDLAALQEKYKDDEAFKKWQASQTQNTTTNNPNTTPNNVAPQIFYVQNPYDMYGQYPAFNSPRAINRMFNTPMRMPSTYNVNGLPLGMTPNMFMGNNPGGKLDDGRTWGVTDVQQYKEGPFWNRKKGVRYNIHWDSPQVTTPVNTNTTTNNTPSVESNAPSVPNAVTPDPNTPVTSTNSNSTLSASNNAEAPAPIVNNNTGVTATNSNPNSKPIFYDDGSLGTNQYTDSRSYKRALKEQARYAKKHPEDSPFYVKPENKQEFNANISDDEIINNYVNDIGSESSDGIRVNNSVNTPVNFTPTPAPTPTVNDGNNMFNDVPDEVLFPKQQRNPFLPQGTNGMIVDEMKMRPRPSFAPEPNRTLAQDNSIVDIQEKKGRFNPMWLNAAADAGMNAITGANQFLGQMANFNPEYDRALKSSSNAQAGQLFNMGYDQFGNFMGGTEMGAQNLNPTNNDYSLSNKVYSLGGRIYDLGGEYELTPEEVRILQEAGYQLKRK